MQKNRNGLGRGCLVSDVMLVREKVNRDHGTFTCPRLFFSRVHTLPLGVCAFFKMVGRGFKKVSSRSLFL